MAPVGAWVALAAALSWIALGVESIVNPGQVNARDLVWFVPFGLTAASLWFVQQVQRGRAPGWGFALVAAACGLAMLGNAGVVSGQRLLAALGFPAGALLLAVGLIVFGVVTLRARVLPAYAGWAIVLWEPGSIATGLALSPIAPVQPRGAYSAGLWKGMMMLAIAHALWTYRKPRTPGS